MPQQPRIAFIVPTLNEEEHLPHALASIVAQEQSCEIIVADGGSSDRTPAIAQSHPSARLIAAPPGRGSQMNAGAARARARILCFLHADSRLPAAASKEIVRLLSSPDTIAGSFHLRFDGLQSPLIWLYQRCSRLNFPLFTYGDQGLFMRTEDFRDIGGFQPYPFLEDVEIQRRIRATGRRFVKSSLAIITSPRRFARYGPLRQQLCNTAIVAAFLCGASPQRLARFYPNLR